MIDDELRAIFAGLEERLQQQLVGFERRLVAVFHQRFEERFAAAERHFDERFEERFAAAERHFEERFEERFAAAERHFDERFDERFAAAERHFDERFEERFTGAERHLDERFTATERHFDRRFDEAKHFFGVEAEVLRSDVRAVAEGHAVLAQRIDALRDDNDRAHAEIITMLRLSYRSVNERVDDVDARVHRLEDR